MNCAYCFSYFNNYALIWTSLCILMFTLTELSLVKHLYLYKFNNTKMFIHSLEQNSKVGHDSRISQCN